MELKEFLDKLIDEAKDELRGKVGAGGPQPSELLTGAKKKEQPKTNQGGDNEESSGKIGSNAAKSGSVKAGALKTNVGGAKTSTYSISKK